jgi:outer membrane protein assembly factor BamA
VVALRAVATMDRPRAGAQVPFFLQQTLGGSHTLRGYHSFRFRDERLLLLQAEYRWEANPALELALFVDAGRASSHDAGWSLDDMHTSWGAGLRVKTFDAVRFRFDVARSPETTRFLVRLGPSF